MFKTDEPKPVAICGGEYMIRRSVLSANHVDSTIALLEGNPKYAKDDGGNPVEIGIREVVKSIDDRKFLNHHLMRACVNSGGTKLSESDIDRIRDSHNIQHLQNWIYEVSGDEQIKNYLAALYEKEIQAARKSALSNTTSTSSKGQDGQSNTSGTSTPTGSSQSGSESSRTTEAQASPENQRVAKGHRPVAAAVDSNAS